MLSMKKRNAWAGVPRGYLRDTGRRIGVTAAGDMYVPVYVSGPRSVFGN